MEQVRGLQFKRLELAHKSGEGPKPLWFSIDSQIGESQAGDSSFASAISTNLKKLSPAEMAVLTRHAGALLDHRLKTYANELMTA
jgi:NTE family protein